MLTHTLRMRFAALLAALSLAFIPSVFAAFDPIGEDIDIFLANPTVTAERPNVLILLDNTANWNTAFTNEKSALVTLINSLTDSFNVGLGMFVETGGGNDNVDGGYIRFGVRQMTAANKTALASMVNNLDVLGDKSNNGTGSLLMYEAYAYFAGITARSTFGKLKRDYTGNTAYNTYAASLSGNALSSSSSSTFVSPIANGCQKNFIIYISNGPVNDNSSGLSTAQTLLAGLVGKNPPDTISITPNGMQNNWMDEYAKFMATNDCNANFSGTQTVTTYTVEVDPGTSGQQPAMTALMKSTAINGKGKYFAVTSGSGGAEILTALKQIFQEVQSVNSVFASTTLPVSVNVRGTNLNQVYIGVFRPDAAKSPRWLGNLKLYNLAVDSATQKVFLADSTGAAAENSSTGFIAQSAKSFWTTDTCFWSYLGTDVDSTDTVPGSCTVPTAYTYWSDLPDGDKVEKGGAAQRLRINYATDHSTRKVYTCIGCAANSLLSASAFNNANTAITASALGTLSTKSVTSLTSVGTTATATVTAHGYASGDSVVMAGASPTGYNGTYSITVVDANTFTYTLASAPSGNIATVAATAHNLSTNDLVDISGGTANGYDVTGAVVTRIDANSFSYTLSAAVTAAASGKTVVGRKLVQTLTGIGTTATVTLPSHGYATGNSITITGASPTEFNASNRSITVTGTDSFTYTTTSSLSGTSSTAQATTTVPHNLSTGDTVTISCASPSTYSASAVISVSNTTTFTYPLATAQSTDATVTTAPTGCSGATNAVVTKSGVTSSITSITGSGSTVTVNTAAAHGFTAGDLVTIAGVTPTAYNGTITIVSAASTSFTYTLSVTSVSSAATPATGTITATVGSTVFTPTAGNVTHGSGANAGTITVASSSALPADFVADATIVIAGATQTQYNGTWKIASRAANDRSITITSGSLAGIPSPTGTTMTASGSITRSIANTCGAGTSACLQRAVSATGSIYAGKTVTVTSMTSQTNATGTITAANQTSGDSAARTALINWVRSQDNLEDENANASLTDVRASAHGDVLHSRPAVINYNRNGANSSNTGDNDIFVFYGANDGMFHALQGGTASNGGNEAWSFVASEFFGKLKRLRDNSPIVSSTNLRDYFFDGSIGVYTKDLDGDGALLASSGDKVYLFMNMRRGGRYIYALDVSDPNAPKFLWKRGCPNLTNNTGCDTGFTELGQTWSEPKIGYLRAYSNPVLFFGAGYDPAVEDFQPCLITAMPPNTLTPLVSPTSVTAQTGGSVTYTSAGSCTYTGTTTTTVNRSMGRGIFMVDATDGTLLQRIGPDVGATIQVTDMQYAIPADLVVLNRDRDNSRTLGTVKENIGTGYIDRIYAADTGGNVWRVDVDSATTSSWVVTKLAALSGLALTDKRKFLFPPDIVYADGYDAVLIGSGDREHPFDATVTNRFYMIKDKKTGLDATGQTTVTDDTYDSSTNPNGLYDTTSDCVQDATVCTAAQQAQAATDISNARGWKLTLGTGEKNVGNATTVAGTTFFNTNQPSGSAGGGSCGSNLGIAREYQVSYKDASATNTQNTVTGALGASNRSTEHAGGGYLPSPVPVIVQIGTKKFQAVISGTSVQNPGGLTLEARIRTYWYRKIE